MSKNKKPDGAAVKGHPLEGRSEHRDSPSNFHTLLTSKLSTQRIERIAKQVDGVYERACNDIKRRKGQNDYFVELLARSSQLLPIVDSLSPILSGIEHKAFSSPPPGFPQIRLEAEVKRLSGQLAELVDKSPLEILFSPTSRRKLEKLEQRRKTGQSKSLLKKLQKEFSAFHHRYEESMSNSLQRQSQANQQDRQKQGEAAQGMLSSLKEDSHKKFQASKSKKRKEKELASNAKAKIQQFLKEKPLYKQFQEDFESKQRQAVELALQQKHEFTQEHAWSREKQREHELKISQILKRRTILHNSLNNLKAVQPPEDPSLEAKRQKLLRMKSFGRNVKENYFPEADPKLIEATEKAIAELERRHKIQPDIAENMEKHRGIGKDYLRGAGRVKNRSLTKTRNTNFADDTQTRMSVMESKSIRPKVDIPHVKTMFDDLTIDDILVKIENNEINESNYAYLLNRLDHAVYPHVVKKLAASLRLRKSGNVQTEFLIGAMKAKLKILDNIS